MHFSTSVAPVLRIVEVSVAHSWKEGVSQCAALAIKGISIVMVAGGEPDFDVCTGRRSMRGWAEQGESEGGRVAPHFQSIEQDELHQGGRQRRRVGERGETLYTAEERERE